MLYHVYSEIPECYWDLDNDPTRPNNLKGFEAWRREKLETIDTFMQEAKSRLVKAGFGKKSVTVKVHKRERGIARDSGAYQPGCA